VGVVARPSDRFTTLPTVSARDSVAVASGPDASRAGTPATREPAATLPATTEPGSMIAPSSIVLPCRMVTLAPMRTPAPMVMGS